LRKYNFFCCFTRNWSTGHVNLKGVQFIFTPVTKEIPYM